MKTKVIEITEMVDIMIALKDRLDMHERWINNHVKGFNARDDHKYILSLMADYADTLKLYNKLHEVFHSGGNFYFELKGCGV